MSTNCNPHIITADNAPKIAEWLRSRGGLFVWKSINLSNPLGSWTTPATEADGTPKTKPTWEAADKPDRHITDMADLVVVVSEEVKRFHVAVRQASNSLSWKVTDGGTRRIRREVAAAEKKYNRPASYAFDYSDYDNAVIFVDSNPTEFCTWLINHLYTVVDELREQLKNAEQTTTPQAAAGPGTPQNENGVGN